MDCPKCKTPDMKDEDPWMVCYSCQSTQPIDPFVAAMKKKESQMTKEETRELVKKVFVTEPTLEIMRDTDDSKWPEPYTISVDIPETLSTERYSNDRELVARGNSWDEAYSDLLSCLQRNLDRSKEKAGKMRNELDIATRRIEWLLKLSEQAYCAGKK